jgi:iron complex outermembrane recepter protein
MTGRAVIDYKLGDDSLLYASYSRGYKSGGINPPLSLGSGVTETFKPEFVDTVEIGSKNTTADGKFSLNLTGIYYKYKDLQLSRIVQRTSVNDNIDADIYGAEAEALVRPDSRRLINLNFSYLKSKITSTTQFTDTRDPSAGRSDAVIIKDISNGSNCAVTSNAGSAAAAQGFVTAVNAGPGLRAPTAFEANSGIAATGAYSICGVLQANASANFTVTQDGLPVGVQDNSLPQSPNFKFSAGAQYTADFGSGMTLAPRVDLTYTGESYATIFNTLNDRIEGYAQVNAQIQLNGNDDRWYFSGFIQNLFDSDAITGKYITDQSSGLFTNVFTLEPRRFGLAAGFKF